MDEDNFFIENLNDNNSKKKKNGGRKGKRIERELSKLLSKRFKKDFSRTVGSGNRWAQAKLPEHAKKVYSGDILCPENFKWVLESKDGYEEIDINSIFLEGNKKLDSFLEQVEFESNRCKRKPMLLWKKDRKPWISFVQTKEIQGFHFNYKLIYKEWTAVALEELLKINDDFFIET